MSIVSDIYEEKIDQVREAIVGQVHAILDFYIEARDLPPRPVLPCIDFDAECEDDHERGCFEAYMFSLKALADAGFASTESRRLLAAYPPAS